MLTGDKARTDSQVAYAAVKQKAKAAAAVLLAGFEEWKKTTSLEVNTKTGATASTTWDRVYHLQGQAPRQLARERPGPRLVRLRGPRVRHVLQLRAGVV